MKDIISMELKENLMMKMEFMALKKGLMVK